MKLKLIFPEGNNALLKNKEQFPYRLWDFFLVILLLQLPVSNHVKLVTSNTFCISQMGAEDWRDFNVTRAIGNLILPCVYMPYTLEGTK